MSVPIPADSPVPAAPSVPAVAPQQPERFVRTTPTFVPQRPRSRRASPRRRSRRFTPLQVALAAVAVMVLGSGALLGLLLWLKPF